jgi:hypothetical protein
LQLVFHPKCGFGFNISGIEFLNDEDHTNARQKMKKDYDIVLATQIRGKWYRVDYINKAGIMEFETVEALDSHEAIIIASNSLYRRYADPSKKLHQKKD